MRILEINTEKSWRGGEKQTLLTTEGLIKKGHDVVLLCAKKSILHQKAIDQKIPCITINNNIDLFFYLIFNASTFNIIHTHTAKALTPCAISKFFHSTKIVFSRRHYKIPRSVFSKWKYNSADYITTISEYIKNCLLTGGITKPIQTIYDASEFVPPNKARIQQEYHSYTEANKKIIATVAAFEDEKDPYTLINAIELLSKDRSDFIFLHFGSGRLEAAMKQLIQDKKMTSVYFCLGQTADVEELYSMFDVFVMSSKNEGFGSSVIDAFLNKVPVVATKVGGLEELVKDRGYLANKQDYRSLSEQLHTCLNSTSTEYIDTAFTFATNELSNAVIQTGYEKLFISLAYPSVQPA